MVDAFSRAEAAYRRIPAEISNWCNVWSSDFRLPDANAKTSPKPARSPVSVITSGSPGCVGLETRTAQEWFDDTAWNVTARSDQISDGDPIPITCSSE